MPKVKMNIALGQQIISKQKSNELKKKTTCFSKPAKILLYFL